DPGPGGACLGLRADVTDDGQVEAALEATEAGLGKARYLVNHAAPASAADIPFGHGPRGRRRLDRHPIRAAPSESCAGDVKSRQSKRLVGRHVRLTKGQGRHFAASRLTLSPEGSADDRSPGSTRADPVYGRGDVRPQGTAGDHGTRYRGRSRRLVR